LPEKRPQLFTELTRYEPGDMLRANCSTPPSRPRAELKFTINNMVVGTSETQYIRTIDNLMASRISLKLQLQGIHFVSGNPSLQHSGGGYNGGSGFGSGYGMNSVHGQAAGSNGGSNVGSLVLRCTAQIGDLYQEYKEIELGTPQKDPVPARVTLSSGSSMTNFFSSYFSSSSSRRYTPPTTIAMLLMAIATITATTTMPTTLTATTMAMLAAVVKLCIAIFAFFNQMAVSAHKLSGKCAEQQHQQNINRQQRRQIQQTQHEQQQALQLIQKQKIRQQSENLCHGACNESWQHLLLLPSQLPLLQNYARQQQWIHSATSYRSVKATVFTHR
ncbi:PREDICTED: uncharacterized protein LOC108367165, partial [Rhagoletis zephyria]|uniref:uncharacterized protein LOC108367165 n=1 Tax=Rhagoletis zephyria TaxID=28612 RepID=UPI000811A4D3